MLRPYTFRVYKTIYITFGLVGLTILFGLLLASSDSFADDSVVDTVNINVMVSCTMNGTGMNSHNAEIDSGTYQADIGTTTLKAFCNDNEGFSIYAIGYTGDQYSGEDHTKLVGVGASQKIATGTATSGTTSNWAMKLATVSSPTPTYPITLDNGYGSYSIVPSTYTKVAHRDSGTDIGTNAEGSTLTTTYAAYISRTQPADTYTGKVKYTLVHPVDNTPKDGPMECSGGYICYSPNANDVLGTMADQSAGNNAEVTLYPSNFSRPGYGFAGWSTTYDYSDSDGFYGPMEDIVTPANISTNGLSLYAIWVQSAGYLQDWTGCSSLNSGAVTALTDQRDNDTYAVAKLADGNCWMIENLRLDNTATGNRTGELAQGYGSSTTYGNFQGLADPESPWVNSSAAANSLYYSGIQEGTASINIGTGGYAGYRFPRYNNQNTSSRANTTTKTQNIYSYGNYYTWHAAIASTSYYSSGNQIVANTSICPTGWHLPSGGMAYASDSTTGVNVTGNQSTYREFYNLGYRIMNEVKTAYQDTANDGDSYYTIDTENLVGDTATKAFRKYPNNFVYSGRVYNNSISYRGTAGLYWTSTNDTNINAYHFNFNNDELYPGTYGTGKYPGRTVRCLVSGV